MWRRCPLTRSAAIERIDGARAIEEQVASLPYDPLCVIAVSHLQYRLIAQRIIRFVAIGAIEGVELECEGCLGALLTREAGRIEELTVATERHLLYFAGYDILQRYKERAIVGRERELAQADCVV